MKTASEIVGEAIGAASMCWSETPKGVFDSSRALVLLEEIMAAITEAVLAEREACARAAAGPDEGFLHGCACRTRILARSSNGDAK